MIQPAAASGFGADAERYDRARPGYPDEVVDRIATLADGRVLDLAAGTGKLTEPLIARGLPVFAVEPVPAMREVLERRTRLRTIAGGVAESLPFVAGAFSLVTVAQAFHWFDASRVWAELCRVVVPGGHAAIVWNARVRHTELQTRLWNLLDVLEVTAPYRGNRWVDPVLPWRRIELFERVHDVPVTVDLLKDRIASVSVVATLDPAHRRSIDRSIEEIVAGDDAALTLRYRSRLFVYRFEPDDAA